MAASRQITINQVAQEAGVSVQTVSRVLNERPDVSPETRRKVQEIITRLGYQPSAIARGLASRRTRSLGLITADFSDYFFTQVIAGAEQEARKHDYFLMLGSTERNPKDEPEYLRLLTQRHVEGILFARPSSEPDEKHLVKLLHTGTPVVSTAYYLEGEALTVVDVNNVEGGRQATSYLLELGHTCIAMIRGPSSWKSVIDRAQGYRLTLEAAGISLDPGLVTEGDWSYRSGYLAMRELLGRGSIVRKGALRDQHDPCTALFIQNDRMAIGAIRALHEDGLRIPEDISVVGYDDVPEAEFAEPPLTTVRQPMFEVGEIATRLLIQAVEHPDDYCPQELLLETELVVRHSTNKRPNPKPLP